jgi:rSAM/selenodomain-associated transferase 2/rSAM/selenodomain-associated transferase 1
VGGAVHRRLVVFTRYPEPGLAKTRLIPALGAAGAADLQRRMTERTLERVGAGGADAGAGPAWEIEVRFCGGDDRLMAAWLGDAVRCLPQGPGDLGERLRRALAAGFGDGAAAVAAIGTDCPELRARDVADAFAALERADTVLGPAVDGGYWIVGARREAFAHAAGPLFTDIPWGGGDVLGTTRAALARAGVSTALLRTHRDVDRPDDLGVWVRSLDGAAADESISVVIPALDEAARIGALVDALLREPDVDVVVADGGSGDGTAAAAVAAGARVVAGPRGRAPQLNAGAAAAGGEVLLFLHADTSLPAGWARAVRDALRDQRIGGGAFSFATDSPRRELRLIERAANWRGRRLGVVFGDQAIFARREVFAALGGFPDQALMEDYELVRRLRRRHRFVVLAEPAVTSARRWEARGPWRTSLRNVAITAAYLAGVAPRRLAAWYRGNAR